MEGVPRAARTPGAADRRGAGAGGGARGAAGGVASGVVTAGTARGGWRAVVVGPIPACFLFVR
eukprot:scaffold88657_cov36-Phaeocystis_antarctica.AAC.1